ncbi:GNAT family N-acetyltransferase [Ferrovibrio xuzhouensis]|uniref:GNAT family N-acetyltransferase n=1 Tax=Ferrovibrio xuzhouensis TaxID=1576914 RepID=A0ABV7VMM2_9PROT
MIEQPTYRIRAARPAEADILRAIESAAGQAFVAVGYGDIAEQEDTTVPALRAAAVAGRLLVIIDAADHPAGFILCRDLDGDLHVQELDVHPDHAGRRLGARLLDAAGDIARTRGLPALSLTTFRSVPWNAPYYARLGFREMLPGEYGPDLRMELARQQAAGFPMADRVAMRRELVS